MHTNGTAAGDAVNLSRDWHAASYIACLAVGPAGLVVRIIADGTSAPGALSMLLGAFFAGLAGSIFSDLWLDQFMDRSRAASTFLGVACLVIGTWALMFQPFG